MKTKSSDRLLGLIRLADSRIDTAHAARDEDSMLRWADLQRRLTIDLRYAEREEAEEARADARRSEAAK